MNSVCLLSVSLQIKVSRAGGVAQTVEHQPSKSEALSPTPNTEKQIPVMNESFQYGSYFCFTIAIG
jgi:hypothetical protein